MSSPVVNFATAARTILIVDDQPSVLAALGFIFSTHGFAVSLASTPAEIAAHTEKTEFDAALIDLHMPGADGITVCRNLADQLRARGRTVPIWVMTAAYTTDAATKAVEAGARGLLKKPFDVFEIVKQIESKFAAQSAVHKPVAPTIALPPPASAVA